MAITKITEKGIKDGEILNADINSSAAIAGSKINPDFGSQGITTTGVASIGNGLTLTGTNPYIDIVDSNNNDDFTIKNDNGIFKIQDKTDTADRLNIDSSGNVGIGTASPRSLLDLGAGSGDGSLSSTLSQYQIMLEAPQGEGDYGRNIGWSVGTNGLTAAINAVDVGASDATALAFITGNTSAVAERLRIDQSGNIVTGAATSPTSSDTGNVYIKPASTIGSAGIGLNIAANAVFNSSWKAIATGATGILAIDSSGGLTYRTDTNTTAGNDFSLKTRFKIAESGKTLLANDSSVTGNANLTGSLSRVQITGPVMTSFNLANSYLHIGGTESNANQLQTISFGHVKTSATYVPAYVGYKTIDSASHENGQIEIATRNVTTDTAPTPSVIIRPSKQLVVRGPSYGIWTETVQTPDGGARDTQFIEDCYGQWVVVAKIHEVEQLKESMPSTATINTTNNDATTTEWSSNWGNTKPSAVRYISASDWNYWRETRVLDWMNGVPHNRPWKEFYTDGQVSGMRAGIDSNKLGWTCNGAWDGFGRWRNPQFEKWRCTDPSQGDPSISRDFFTTAGQTMDWDNGNTDAKVGCHWKDTVGGQDDHTSTGYGYDDNTMGRIDNFPSTTDTNMSGTDVAEHGLWILINLDGPEVSH